MGSKSTVELTRAEAVSRYVQLYEKILVEQLRRSVPASLLAISDKELEALLEQFNDAACGGEGFENYLITGP